jgi:hypothetical protein
MCGVNASICGSTGPPTNVPGIAENRSHLLPCHRPLPGNVLPPKTASVSWDGYLSYDGVLYGLPSSPPVAGAVVQVREWHGILKVWSGGQLLVELAKRPVSQTQYAHPDQWRNVAPAASRRAQIAPIGHLRPAPQVVKRELAEYDHLCGVEVLSCNLN